ncbi:MAG: peptidase S9 [Bacteroidetes bacterium]|jgi:hypothetical protein|nr:peptidase S9 [Bacteroidota bacterium]
MQNSARRLSLLAALAAILLGTVGLTPAQAQYFGRNKVQYDDFDFQRFETEHFELFFYPEEEQAVKDMARMAERWYRRHSRTFLREFDERKPLILYANDADFQQTNVIGGRIGQGTGGVTESLKERVVMPLTGIYAENDHVLGHELVHSFQYDIALNRSDSTRFALNLLPLWLIEGMAEYLSVGRQDPHTAMWLRDYALRDDLPTIDDLTRSRKYFPYRFGQAYMAYVGGKYGDAAVANLFKLGGRAGLDSAFVYTLGITTDSLSTEWIQAVKDTYLPLTEGRTPVEEAGRRILAEDLDAGDINISPAVSPDGRYVAFLSERDVFNINLFVADAETGKVVDKLGSTAANPHFDAIRFINSAGTWSPDGQRFAFVTFVEGDNELSIWNLNSGDIERRIKVQDVTALSNPAWSPDGRYVAFSGIEGGISDLYVLDLETRDVRQLTDDRYMDMQPAWSPDGETIAVVTDRGPEGTDFGTLRYGDPRIGLVDVATGDIEVARPFDRGKHINPQFSPDGQSLYFIADQDGFQDVYRLALDTRETYRITTLQTGVTGITALSPAMSVAAQSGRMMFSVFSENKYSVFALEPDELDGQPLAAASTKAAAPDSMDVIDAVQQGELALAQDAAGQDTTARASGYGGLLPPTGAADEGLVANYLDDPVTGLPDETEYAVKDYSSKLRLDYVAPPTVGVSVGGVYGSGVGGGVGFFFSDMLGNRNLTVVAQANGTLKDIGGQVSYLDRGGRFNYGGAVAHIPLLFGGTGFTQDDQGNLVLQEIRQRIFIDRALAIGTYPLSTTNRFEANVGFVRYGFDYEAIEFTINNGVIVDRDRVSLDELEPPAEYFFQSGLAYVGDFSNFGFTSPLQGGRYRFEVSPQIGTSSFVTALADYRRYLFANPFTFAVRGMHVGNYGAKFNDDRLFGREYLGYSYYPGFVRGYSFNNFEEAECNPGDPRDVIVVNGQQRCAVINRLEGTRIAMASAEIRLPLLGTEDLGLINFPYLPTELALFSDAGLAWNEGDNPFDLLRFDTDTNERVPVVSVGASTRFNLLGYLVFEIYYAYPFQRPDKGGHFGFQLLPGW